ncbi:MAG: RNA polymerase sigma factor SigF [Thermosynechococcaceae cyanobacterium]
MPPTCTRELKSNSLQLLQTYRSSPSTQLRNQLVQMNLGLVRKESHRWTHNSGETFDDLLQVGCFGLIQAIERFDPTKGTAFSSFAIPYIRGEIQHYLRDKSPQVRIPRRCQELQSQVVKTTHRMRDELQRQPTESEVAEALGVSADELQEVKLAISNRSLLSLDTPVQAESESVSMGDLLPDQQYRSFQLAQDDQIRLRQALETLEKRTSDVIEFVFLYDLTQKETAERLGISAVTVSRQVKKGLAALRHLLKGTDEDIAGEAEL